MHKRLIWSFGSVFVLAAAVAVIVLAGSQTRLRVDIAGLPEGAATRIAITGPVSYEISGPDDREVPEGTYVLRIDSVHTPLGRAYTETDELRTTVPSGETITATVDYAVIIPDTTKVLDFTNPGITRVDGLTVTFAAGSASVPQLVPGHIFVVAEGPQTPQPLARKIVSVTQMATGVIATTTPVELSEALPAARFSFDDNGQAVTWQPAAYNGSRDPMFSVNFLENKLTKGNRVCEKMASGKFVLDVYSFQPEFKKHLSWRAFPPKVDLDLEISLNPEIGVAAEISAHGSCKVSAGKEFPVLKPLCGKVFGKLLRVGPVSLKCQVEPFVRAEAEIKRTVALKLDATLHIGSKGIGEPTGVKVETRPPEVVNASATIRGEVGAKLRLAASDPSDTLWLAINLEAAFGPEYTLSASEPTHQVNGRLKLTAEAEMKIDARFKDWKRTKTFLEVEKTWRWWQRDDPDSRNSLQPPAKPPSDVDGDGYSDEATLTTGAGDVVVTVAFGNGVTQSITDEGGFLAKIVGVTDLNGDGRDEVIFRSTTGSSTMWYGVAGYFGGGLKQVTDGGENWYLLSGAAANYSTSFGCYDGKIRRVRIDSSDGVTFKLAIEDFKLTGDGVAEKAGGKEEQGLTREAAVAAWRQADPKTCAGLSLS